MFLAGPNEICFATRAKARLVARGCRQLEGVDFFKTFAPTPTASCIRLLRATACELDVDLCHFDSEKAFARSKLGEDVFMRLLRLWRDVWQGSTLDDACVMRWVESGSVFIVTVSSCGRYI